MVGDVKRLKQKLHSKKFATAYQRHLRDDTTLNEVPASERDILKYIPPLEGHVYGITREEPKAGYVKLTENNLEDVLPYFNQLLLYRILRLLYGPPDILSAYASPSAGTCSPVDWGFSFSVQPDLIAEVRNKFTSRVYFSYWAPAGPVTPDTQERRDEGMAKCLTDLKETVEKNLHLWDEKEELRDRTGRFGLVNVPAEKYKGGELLLLRARESDRRPLKRAFEYGETQPLLSVGHLYLSAATMFFVAFESFVNLLYRLLLRKEFRSGTYERLTVRSDLDLRLVSMHVFCHGFQSQTVQPNSDLWLRMIQLRDFRNDVVHGNITEEHKCHSLQEDGFMFFYLPASDYRGRRRDSVPKSLSRFQSNVNEDTVRVTKQTVDDLREAILGAMDSETRTWVASWLWHPIIPVDDSERL